MVGANMIVGVDLNPAREALGRKFGMTHFVNPETLEGKDLVAHLVELTDGGADYSFECVGNTKLMRQALECCHRGWGKSVIIGVAGAGQEIRDAAVPARDRPRSGWARRSAAPRGGATCRRSSTGTWTGKIDIDSLITHIMPVEKINDAFDLMHRGPVDPQRRHVLGEARMTVRKLGNATIEKVEEICGAGFKPAAHVPATSTSRPSTPRRPGCCPSMSSRARDRLVGSVHTWIVKTPRHTILIDTCLGNHKQRTNPGWNNLDTPFLERLKACGCPPESVDFVMCTHLHVDHVGWNTKLENGRWVPTFPNAQYLFGKARVRPLGKRARQAGRRQGQ